MGVTNITGTSTMKMLVMMILGSLMVLSRARSFPGNGHGDNGPGQNFTNKLQNANDSPTLLLIRCKTVLDCGTCGDCKSMYCDLGGGERDPPIITGEKKRVKRAEGEEIGKKEEGKTKGKEKGKEEGKETGKETEKETRKEKGIGKEGVCSDLQKCSKDEDCKSFMKEKKSPGGGAESSHADQKCVEEYCQWDGHMGMAASAPMVEA